MNSFLVPVCIPLHVFKEELRKRMGNIGKTSGLYCYVDKKLISNSGI